MPFNLALETRVMIKFRNLHDGLFIDPLAHIVRALVMLLLLAVSEPLCKKNIGCNKRSVGKRECFKKKTNLSHFHQKRGAYWESEKSKAVMAAVTMKRWSSRSLEQQGGCTASSLPYTSEQTLVFSTDLLGRVS